MIFVTVGTNETPFDRLLEGIVNFPADEELIVQHGSSHIRPAGAQCVAYLSFDEVVEHVTRARAVVTHAGVGSIIVCLGAGHQPIIMPRRRMHAEAVDDHQVALAERMQVAGLVRVVDDPAALGAAVHVAPRPTAGRARTASRLTSDLDAMLDDHIGRIRSA
jgi:UDP-N-acetylglucosamine transferase subunit ALG13